MKTPDLMRKQGKPQLFVDGESIVREQKKVILAGWAVGTTPVSLQVYDENKKPVKITLKRNTRMDVAEMFRECEVNKDCGFHIQAENVSGKKAYLVAKDENGKKAVYQIGISKGERFKAKASLYSKKGNGELSFQWHSYCDPEVADQAGSIEQGRRSLPDLAEGEQGY